MSIGLSIAREFWNLETTDIDELRERARAVAWRGGLRESGASVPGRLAHFAGRAAVNRLFESRGIKAWVYPDPEYGFLRVRDVKGPRRDLFVNITHTSGIAVAALSYLSVGIDIESLTRNTDRVLPRVSSEEERVQLAAASLPEGLPRGVALWTAKEAISKASGLGIKFGLQEFSVDWLGDSPRSVIINRPGPLALKNPGVTWLVDKTYALCVCTEKDTLTGEITEL